MYDELEDRHARIKRVNTLNVMARRGCPFAGLFVVCCCDVPNGESDLTGGSITIVI